MRSLLSAVEEKNPLLAPRSKQGASCTLLENISPGRYFAAIDCRTAQ